MNHLLKLRELVDVQYARKLPDRDDWCDWLYENHVNWVADRAQKLCEQYGGDADIAVASALVHDIADSVMSRFDDGHEAKSLEIGRVLCEEAGYNTEEVAIIIDDICLRHSCRNGEAPESLEGKIMATADACFHFETDFYLFAFFQTSGSIEDFAARKKWMAEKLEKDFHKKLFFDDVRKKVKPRYEALLQITR